MHHNKSKPLAGRFGFRTGLKHYQFSKANLLLVILVIAGIGGYILLSSSAATSTVGDANNDGLVNGADLSLLLSKYGSTDTSADFNQDSNVNVLDFSILLSHFGASVTPPSGGGTTVGVPYTCTGPVNNIHVVGTGSNSIALVNLKSGCTGNLSFDIHVTSGGGDGVKVQGGAHDLNIGPSTILCDTSPAQFHEDGVQVQGGTNVTFHNLKVVCPYINGQGAGAFYINGKDFGPITNVICDGCNLEHTHGGVTYNQGSGHPHPVNSGARNSILHNPHPSLDYTGGATGFLNQNNTIAPVCYTLAGC